MASSAKQKVAKGMKKVQANNQTMADYWLSNPKHYYVRQAIVFCAEIAFLVSCAIMFARDSSSVCFDGNGDEVQVDL